MKFKDLKKGMMIVDYNDGDEIMYGKIDDCSDIHNVYISYDFGGKGLLCFDEDCDGYDGPHDMEEMSKDMKLKRAVNAILKILTA